MRKDVEKLYVNREKEWKETHSIVSIGKADKKEADKKDKEVFYNSLKEV